jgi:ACS family tartrate transporter-like MFS transporter
MVGTISNASHGPERVSDRSKFAGTAIYESGAVIDPDTVMSKIVRRTIPLLAAGFVAAYLDRVNIGFAALTMNEELNFSPEFFGWGAGVFFIGYCLFEAPSNYVLHRVGARIWIARIMVSWGVISAMMAVVWSGASFVALRFLLGVSEAGFAPGVILYLTYWIPAERRARVLGAFLFAVPLSSVIGAPLSGLVLSTMDGVANLSAWRWLFIVEAVPSILLGILVFFCLTDRPVEAAWLQPDERLWLKARLEADARDSESDEGHWRVLRDPQVILLGFAYFGVVGSLYGLNFWLPQIIDAFGYGVVASGLLTAVPYACGGLAMIAWGRRSDRRNERVKHTVFAAIFSCIGLFASSFSSEPVWSMAFLSLAATGTLASMPAFWSLSTMRLGAADAAVGIAVINSIGNLAGFVGPYLVGWIKSATGDFSSALLILALGPLFTAGAVFWIGQSATAIAQNKVGDRVTHRPPRA